MSTQPVEILIRNIKTELAYYPRSQPDQERIKEFVEAMECGEYFPPVKVAKGEGKGVYILLDGKHRLEAKKLRGETKTPVNIFPVKKEHWLMSAARFNSKSSKPLHPDEIKKIIIASWQNGIKDTAEIAREMGRTVRYIEMVLKPIRDEERDKRDETILKLHQQGMSQRKIASEIGISPSAINKSLKSKEDNNRSKFQEHSQSAINVLQKDNKVFSKRNDFVLRTPNKIHNISGLKILLNKTVPNQESFEPANPAVKNQIKVASEKTKISSNISLGENHQINDSDGIAKNSDQSIHQISSQAPSSVDTVSGDGIAPAKPVKQEERPSLFPTYLDQIDFYNKLPKKCQHAMRAMELAKTYKMDIIDMIREINEPVRWIRKILIAAIAIALMPANHFDIATSVEKLLGINFEISRCIQQALPFKKMLCPVSPDMEGWMKDNISDNDFKKIATLADVTLANLLYLIKGEMPPVKKNYFEELPDSYKDQLQSHVIVLRELRNHVKNHMFQDDSAKQLMVHLNKNMTVINEIFDGLREVNVV